MDLTGNFSEECANRRAVEVSAAIGEAPLPKLLSAHAHNNQPSVALKSASAVAGSLGAELHVVSVLPRLRSLCIRQGCHMIPPKLGVASKSASRLFGIRALGALSVHSARLLPRRRREPRARAAEADAGRAACPRRSRRHYRPRSRSRHRRASRAPSLGHHRRGGPLAIEWALRGERAVGRHRALSLLGAGDIARNLSISRDDPDPSQRGAPVGRAPHRRACRAECV